MLSYPSRTFSQWQVDFSAAFNMIDQDRLLVVLYDVGFPTDVVEVVKDRMRPVAVLAS
jgi:hypothetical protein